MARSYGNDTGATSSAREALQKQQAQERAAANRIELIVTIAAIAIAVLSIVINAVRCVGAVAAKSDYNKQKVEATATYEELYAKLQDPAAQNFSYMDPTVGNMTETGQAIALMQNQIIAGQQILHNANSQSDMSVAPGSATATFSDADDVHDSTTSETGGSVVSLDPTDGAPTGSDEPDSETVDNSEATISIEDTDTDDSTGTSDIEYTPISDLSASPTDATTSTETTSQNSTPDNNVYGTTATRSQADLIKEFQTKYFSKPITNVDMVDANSTAWSWYGIWEFSGTYDFSAQEVPAMNAVWTCYEPSDVGRLRPLAFVTATYSPAQKRFTNAEATYTQYYVHYSEAQKDAFGSNSAGGGNPTGSQQTTLDTNGQGSENEYAVVNIDNGESDDDESAMNKPSNGNGNSNNNPNGNNGSGSSNTDPANNPNGVAPWNPGGGASDPSSGTWIPSDGSNPGTWVPSDGSGTWVPSDGSSASNGTGTWTPAN